jgi:hypothetical protein
MACMHVLVNSRFAENPLTRSWLTSSFLRWGCYNDDGGPAAAPLAPVPPTAVPEEIIKEEAPTEMVLEQEAPVVHEVILVDAKHELLQPRLFNMIMRDYEESPPRMENGLLELDHLDDLYDLDDDTNEGHSDMDEWFPEDGSNDQD